MLADGAENLTRRILTLACTISTSMTMAKSFMVSAPSKALVSRLKRSLKRVTRAVNFRELFDLCARTDIKKLNRRVLEKLIMSRRLTASAHARR